MLTPRPTYLPRAIGSLLREALEEMPVVVVTGLRQSGKSTLLQREEGLARREYVSLDDFAQLEEARNDPERFLRRDGPLTVDEAQRCPDLLLAIKSEVDRHRRPGRFLLSGSANFALLQGVSESLAGRAVHLTLHPFTRREIRGRARSTPAVRKLFETGALPRATVGASVTVTDVMRGGLPPVCLNPSGRTTLWFTGYEQTYLDRDVRDLSRQIDLHSFRHLLHLAALRTGQVLNVSELGRDARLPSGTVSRYLELLEASFVIRRMGPYLSNRTSRLIKSPKLYVTDSGLAGHLAGVDAATARGDPLYGALLETYFAENLLATLEASWPGARLAYWHVQGRHEVDFVIHTGKDCLAIEVKATGRWNERDLAGLRIFLERTPHCRAAVLAHGGTEIVSLGERLWAAPIGELLA